MPAPASLTDEQRARLISLLAERARLLAPSAELIERAVRRAAPPNGSHASSGSQRAAAVSGMMAAAAAAAQPAGTRGIAATPALLAAPSALFTPSQLATPSASAVAAAAAAAPSMAEAAPAAETSPAAVSAPTAEPKPALDGAPGAGEPSASAAAGGLAVDVSATTSIGAPAASAVSASGSTVTAVARAPGEAEHPAGDAPAPGAVAVEALAGASPGASAAPDAGSTPSAQTVISRHGEEQAVESVGTGRYVTLKPGSIIAGYRIEALIGHGGMGQVYRATQLSMNREVAFKVLSPKLAGNPRFRDRFLREARAAGRLHHPNLIAVHDVGEADRMMYFSMELVTGATLSSVLKKHGKSPESRAIEIVRQVLEALKIAHGAGIVHRDIKPENLMLTAQGMVKVADLGLSLSDENEEDAYTTQAGTLMGTPNYMAPEQGRDAHAVDLRADLYGVGATLFHLVCGSVPFPGETPMEVVIKASSQPLRFPEPGPSPGVRALIQALMEKNPSDRPQSADQALEMIARLRRARVETNPEQHPEAATAIARARGRRWRRTLRKAGWFGGIALGGLVLALFAALMVSKFMWGHRQHDIEALAAEHRYHEALTDLERYQPGFFGARRADLDRLHSEIEKAWDAWAFPLATPVFDEFHAQLRAKKLRDANESLTRNLKVEWLSPLVRHDQEECEAQYDEALSALEKVEPARVSSELLPELRKRIGELWKEFAATPPATMEVKDEVARFIGSGTASGGGAFGAQPGPRLHRLSVQFNVRVIGPGADDADLWSMVLAPTRILVANRSGLFLRENAKPDRQLAPSGSNGVTFRLRHAAGNELEVRIGPADTSSWISLGICPPGQLSLKWHLGDNRAAEVRMRPLLSKAEEPAH
jgi:serine/threonine-protein kinase